MPCNNKRLYLLASLWIVWSVASLWVGLSLAPSCNCSELGFDWVVLKILVGVCHVSGVKPGLWGWLDSPLCVSPPSRLDRKRWSQVGDESMRALFWYLLVPGGLPSHQPRLRRRPSAEPVWDGDQFRAAWKRSDLNETGLPSPCYYFPAVSAL